MRNAFFTIACLLFLIGCSTNNGVITVVPAAPTNLTGTAISGTQINLSWTDNATNEIGYKIQRKTTSGSFSDVGSTGSDISIFNDQGLTPNTIYIYRVYAYNGAGNSAQYSNEVTVSTNSSSPSLCEITIGSQIWSCKNLDVDHYRNGDPIPQVTDPIQWATLTTGAWCYYNNDPTLGPVYGKLYNWYAVNDPRGLAPTDWHVPSETDWNKLVKHIDPNSDTTCQSCGQSVIAGGAMKETGITHWTSPNTGATNTSGFTGLPGGFRLSSGTFQDLGNSATWWSSTSYNATNALNRYLYYSTSELPRTDGYKKEGTSVRLVRD